MITITQGEFLERTGIDLTASLRAYGIDNDKMADILLTRWTKRIYNEAKNCGFPIRDTQLTDFQLDALIDSICEYGNYCFHKGDFIVNGGVDEDGRQIKDMLPKIIQDLKDAGLIRTNLKGR